MIRIFILFFLMAVTADAIAQDVMLPYIPIYGKYYCHDKDLSVDIVKQNSKDSMAIIYNKVRHSLMTREFGWSYYFADSVNLIYSHDSLKINNDVYYRKTGYNEDGKCFLKYRYRFSEGNVFCKHIRIEKRGRVVSHYCNGKMNGKFVVKRRLHKTIRGQYINGLKDGKWVYRSSYRSGKIWYAKDKEIKEKNVKYRHPKRPPNFK